MLGKFIVYVNGKKKFYSYSKLYNMQESRRNWLLDTLKSTDIKCGCNDSIGMNIVKGKTGLYYLRTAKGQKSLHTKKCNWRGSSDENSNKTGLIMTAGENGHYFRFNFKKNFFNLNAEISKSLSNISSSVSFSEFVFYFNAICWEGFIKGRGKLPKDINAFFKFCYGKSNAIKLSISDAVSLNDYYYTSKRAQLMTETDRLFIYMLLKENPEKDNSKNGYWLSVYNPVFGEGRIKIFAPASLMTSLVTNSNRSDGHSVALISGVIRKNLVLNHLEFEEISLYRTTEKGLIGINEGERLVFEKLEAQNRLYLKPYVPIPELNDQIPSFILIDGKTEIYGEVGGIPVEKSENGLVYWVWDGISEMKPFPIS